MGSLATKAFHGVVAVAEVVVEDVAEPVDRRVERVAEGGRSCRADRVITWTDVMFR